MADSLHYRSSLDSNELESEKEELLLHSVKSKADRKKSLHVLACLLVVSLAANVVQLLGKRTLHPPRLFSPANAILEDELVQFGSSVKGTGFSEFQGPPSEENNRLWRSLYDNSIIGIPASEARLLPNKTASATPWLDAESSKYVVLFNVFHDLHCLHRLRQTIYYFHEPQFNSTHNPYSLYEGNVTAALHDRGGKMIDLKHSDHCIEMLRQAAMCHSDVTPVVYQYSEKTGKSTGRTGVLHQCKNFSKLQHWTKQRTVDVPDVWGRGPELGLCGVDDPETCIESSLRPRSIDLGSGV